VASEAEARTADRARWAADRLTAGRRLAAPKDEAWRSPGEAGAAILPPVLLDVLGRDGDKITQHEHSDTVLQCENICLSTELGWAMDKGQGRFWSFDIVKNLRFLFHKNL
jgi:hypothetical protein